MKRKDYVEQNELAFGLQLKTFDDNIGNYPGFGLTAGQLASHSADTLYYNNLIERQSIAAANAKSATAWRNDVRNGSGSGTEPAPTALPAAVPPVDPGVEQRFRELCGIVKDHATYNEPIGIILGIAGIVVTPPDMNSLQPTITAIVTATGVIIGWNFGGNAAFLDALEIQLDKGDAAGFATITTDPTPGYTDTTPFPAVATKWSYRAIYRLNDARVGQWSAVVSVMVGG